MKKKILSILITILALCTCMFTLTACGENEPPHTHTYSVLKYDTENHWYECSCGAYEIKENHNPGAEATETTDQKCTECGYVITSALGHVHTLHLTKVDAKPQSCTKEGNIEYYTCSCGKWFANNTATTEITDKSSVVIEKDAHKYQMLKKTATEHWWECSCGAYETKENHNPGAEATETTDQKCTECNYVITSALGHVHKQHLTKVDAKPQSCTATGNVEYYTCSCGKWFTDNTATTEITDKSSVVIEKDAHKYETLKKTATEHWWECSCGAYETKENHKGGTATCQVKATCSVCDTIYGDFAEHEPKTAWVITDTHHYHECVYGCTEKLNYSEHSFTDYVSNKDATYEKDGTKTATCNGGCGKTHTVTDVGSMLFKDEIRFTTLTVDGKNVYGIVSNATTEFVFYEEIFVSGNATYVVDNDKDCTSPIDSKTVDLVVGDNTFYVLETVGNNVKLYTVTIHRRAMFTITFNTNGGTSVDSQIVEEDSFATAPITSKTGYTFTGWDYDFNTAITKDTVVNAEWSINQYTITIVYNNGQNDLVITQDYNSDIATVSNPTKTGYSFTGWDKTIPSKMPAYDVTVNATWKINQYTLTIVYGNGQTDKQITQDYNTNITETLPEMSGARPGYTFNGWDKTIPTTMPADNITITAKWHSIFGVSGSAITGLTAYGKANYTVLNIPSVIDGRVITSIDSSAFSDCSFLTSITIPDSVTRIGNYAFSGCSSLTKVNYLGTIDQWAQISFSSSNSNPLIYAKNLYINNELVTEANITTATKINNYAFYKCYSLTSVEIGNGVTSIGSEAFYNCDSLTSVVIGNSVTSIGSEAFYNCDSLTSIEIPNSVTYIGNYAFRYCSSLTSVVIGNGVTSIGSSVFDGCPIEKATIPTLAISHIEENKLKDVIINGGTSIGSHAFYNCYSLTSVVIGDSVTSIGSEAFYNCDSLTSITIPDSVTSIGSEAFYDCSSALYTVENNLKYVKANGNPYYILIEATNKNLSTYQINANTKYIGSSVFNSCDRLTSITIPNSVTSIGGRAFYNCGSLTSIEIGNGVTSIVPSAFEDCSSLANVTIGNGVKSIGSYAFSGCSSLANVTIGNSVTSIGVRAFYNCSSLTSIVIPDSVTSIGYCAFSCCSKLTSIVIPDSVTSIGEGAFSDCESLTSVTIGNSVTSIGRFAFSGCYSLTSIEIPESVTSIGDSAFSGCSKLTNIAFSDTSTWYRTDNYSYWQIKINGTQTSVTSSSANANYFKSTYKDYYWYKK